jgi:hypothetical protein
MIMLSMTNSSGKSADEYPRVHVQLLEIRLGSVVWRDDILMGESKALAHMMLLSRRATSKGGAVIVKWSWV